MQGKQRSGRTKPGPFVFFISRQVVLERETEIMPARGRAGSIRTLEQQEFFLLLRGFILLGLVVASDVDRLVFVGAGVGID